MKMPGWQMCMNMPIIHEDEDEEVMSKIMKDLDRQ